MNLSALRTWKISRSVPFKWPTIPSTRRSLQRPNAQFVQSRKRYIYNVSGPRDPKDGTEEYYLWEPEESGYFYCKGFLREGLAQYRSGGYHPVHLGDTMKGGRYRIVQKLGWGRDATVWLAEDRRVPRHVAIKVLKSDRRHDGEEEAGILKRLTESPTSHSGKSHVIQLLDLFELKGPNGRHLCLVIEAVGPRIEAHELSPKAAWEVARQLVEATAYFHDLGIVHGDLYHEKIRFSNTNLLHRNGNPMNPVKKPKISNVRPVDKFGNVESILGQVSTARVPRYLVKSLQSYPESIPCDAVKKSGVKIIGFGEPFLSGKQSGAKIDFHYQAPELVLSSQLDACADIWGLGCMIYELVCIERLVYLWCDTKDDVVDEWISAFGDLPEEWKSHCPAKTADSAIPGSFSISNGLQLDLSTMIPGAPWFSKPSLDALGDLLTSMTQYHPSDRPSATQVLQHPWFQRCPSFIHVPVPTEEEQALADLETLKSLNLDPKTVIIPTCLERWHK